MKYVLFFLVLTGLFNVSVSQSYDLLPVNVYNSISQKYPKGTDGGLNSSQFHKSDLDLDGVEELIIYQRKAKNWLVYQFDVGTSTYHLDYQLSIALPLLNQEISILRDYNCDGKEDLFVNDGNHLVLWENVSSIGSISFDSVGVLTYGSDTIFNRSYDLPGIEDIDSDGDMDVLCYGLNGIYLEYYKNMSQELYGVCDSLVFELANECWGHFSEDNTSSSDFDLFLLDTCINNVANPQKKMHTGSAITVLDYDGDGVKDLLVGDVGYSNLVYAENFGTQPNQNSSLINAQVNFPNNTIPINVDRFPAGYWLDINNDGVKDLVVSPNTDLASNNESATWYYQNFGSSSSPSLNQISSAFLQGDMLDFGYSSNVSITDFNNDGKKDIAVSCYNTFVSGGVADGSKIVMLENITTGDTLSFKTISDYGGLLSQSFKGVSISIEDLEGDGFKDILYGDESGQIHLARQDQNGIYTYNTALTNSMGRTIDVGQFSAPQLFDYDDDGDFDLAIGNRLGKIAFFENIGNSTSFSFDSITSDMGGVNVLRDLTNGGYARPHFVKDTAGVWELWVGSYTGQNYYYRDVEGNATNSFILSDSLNFNFGINTSISVFERNDLGEEIFVLGTERGGVSFFAKEDLSLSTDQFKKVENLKLNVRELNGELLLESPRIMQDIQMYDLLGQEIISLKNVNTKSVSLSKNNLHSSIYLIRVNAIEGTGVVKVFLTNN